MLINDFTTTGVKGLFSYNYLKKLNIDFETQWKKLEQVIINNPIDLDQNQLDKISTQSIEIKIKHFTQYDTYFNFDSLSNKEQVLNTLAILNELPEEEQKQKKNTYTKAVKIFTSYVKELLYLSYLSSKDLAEELSKQEEIKKDDPSYTIDTFENKSSNARWTSQFYAFGKMTQREYVTAKRNAKKLEETRTALKNANDEYEKIKEDYSKLEKDINKNKSLYPEYDRYREMVEELIRLKNQPPKFPKDPLQEKEDKESIALYEKLLGESKPEYKKIIEYLKISENLKAIQSNSQQILDDSAKITNTLKNYYKLAMEAVDNLAKPLSDEEFLVQYNKYKEIIFMMGEEHINDIIKELNYDKKDKELEELINKFNTYYLQSAVDVCGQAANRLGFIANPYYVKYDSEQLVSIVGFSGLDSTPFLIEHDLSASSPKTLESKVEYSPFQAIINSNAFLSTGKLIETDHKNGVFHTRLEGSIKFKLNTLFNGGAGFKFYNSSTGENIAVDESFESIVHKSLVKGTDIIAIGEDGTIKNISIGDDNQGYVDIRDVDTISYESEDLPYVQRELSKYINELPDHESIFFSNQTRSFVNFSNTLKELAKMDLNMPKPTLPVKVPDYYIPSLNQYSCSPEAEKKYQQDMIEYELKLAQYNEYIKTIKNKIQEASNYANEYLEDKKWTTKKFTSNTWDRINFAQRFRDRFLNANKLEEILNSNKEMPKESMSKIHETLRNNNFDKKLYSFSQGKEIQEAKKFVAYGDKYRGEIEYTKEMGKYLACKIYLDNTYPQNPFNLTNLVNQDDADFLNEFGSNQNHSADDWNRAVQIGHKIHGLDKNPEKLYSFLINFMEANIEFDKKPKPAFYQFKAKEIYNKQLDLLNDSLRLLLNNLLITKKQRDDLLKFDNIEDVKKYVRTNVIKQVSFESISGTDLLNEIKESFTENSMSKFDLKFTKAIEEYTAAKKANDTEKMAQLSQLYKEAITLKNNLFSNPEILTKAIQNYATLTNIHNRDKQMFKDSTFDEMLRTQEANLREIKENYILKFITEDQLNSLKNKSFNEINNEVQSILYTKTITDQDPLKKLDDNIKTVNEFLGIPKKDTTAKPVYIKNFIEHIFLEHDNLESSLLYDDQSIIKKIDKAIKDNNEAENTEFYFKMEEMKDAKTLFDTYLEIKRKEYGLNNITKLTQFMLKYKNARIEFEKQSKEYNDFFNSNHTNIEKEIIELKDRFKEKEESFKNMETTILKCRVLTSGQLNQLMTLDNKDIEKFIRNNVYTEHEKFLLESSEIYNDVHTLIDKASSERLDIKKLFSPKKFISNDLSDEKKLVRRVIIDNKLFNLLSDAQLIESLDFRKEQYNIDTPGDKLLYDYRESMHAQNKLDNTESFVEILKNLGQKNKIYEDLQFNYQKLVQDHPKQKNTEDMKILREKLSSLDKALKLYKDDLIVSGIFTKENLEFGLNHYNDEKALSNHIREKVYTPREKLIAMNRDGNKQLTTSFTKLNTISANFINPVKKESIFPNTKIEVFNKAYINAINSKVPDKDLAKTFYKNWAMARGEKEDFKFSDTAANNLINSYRNTQKRNFDVFDPEKLANTLKGYKEAVETLKEYEEFYNEIEKSNDASLKKDFEKFCSNYENLDISITNFENNMVYNGILTKQNLEDTLKAQDVDKFVKEEIFFELDLKQIKSLKEKEKNIDNPSL